MIHHLVPVPLVTFTDLHSVVVEGMQAPLMHIHSAHEGGFKMIRPEFRASFMASEVAYASSIEAFLNLERRMAKDPTPVTVFLGAPPPVLREYKLASVPVLKLTHQDVVGYLMQDATYTGRPQHTGKQDIISFINGSSTSPQFLSRIHGLFYRIPKKEDRNRLRSQVYEFLVGLRMFPGPTGIPLLDKLLDSDEARNLRTWVTFSLTSDVDSTLARYPEANEFEILYLRAAHAKLS